MRHLVCMAVAAAITWAASWGALVHGQTPAAAVAAEPDDQAILAVSRSLVDGFNGGKPGEVAALFLSQGELTDDAGSVHKGRSAIESILTRFFELFPGAQMKTEVESIRLIGASLAIEEGRQMIATQDGEDASANRYTAVLAKQNGSWSYASCQLETMDEMPTPHARLEPLGWLVGDWVDEDPQAVVAISCRWSGDGNFLEIGYDSKIEGTSRLNSRQFIGWDPLTQRVRSWVFDSDGGYGEGYWTQADSAWIIKSTAVLPNGETGSATLVVEPAGQDKFLMKGLDRILGDGTQPDFSVTIVRKPPQPAE